MLDPHWGGIWFGSRSPQFDGGFIYERRTEHQASALAIFAKAYQHNRDSAWLEAIANAEDALRSVGQVERLRVQGNFIGQYVLAVNQWRDKFIQVNVVCRQPNSAACTNLHNKALFELEHPRAIVKVQTPGYYPDRGEATLFVCDSTACSTPMAANDAALTEKTRRYFAVLDAGQKSG
ncbi:MAG: hypothetical protein HOI95_10630 [Chromatiales bacterium]|jgi:hypothetical protein|nr:hypothetical protein [Chromatiales bacterium]